MSYVLWVLHLLANPLGMRLDRRHVQLISDVSIVMPQVQSKGNYMSQDVAREIRELQRCLNVRGDPIIESFNMDLAQPHSRSVRLNGLATCLRLEEVYWNILTEIASFNGCSINAVLSYVDREVHLRYGGVKNFSGLVRVVCVAHLLNAEGFRVTTLEHGMA